MQTLLAGQQTPFYSLALGYDASSNVTQTTTTLSAFGSNSAGTDSQSFCYDEFNRLVWAGTSGTPTGPAAGSCGPTPGGTTLSGAGYTATYAYDTLDRLTTGPAGSYTYGDSAHLHALTATSNGHGYAYDASGDATCQPHHMRKTPNWVSGIGALSAAAMPSPSTVRVSAGSMMPSSHSRAVL